MDRIGSGPWLEMQGVQAQPIEWIGCLALCYLLLKWRTKAKNSQANTEGLVNELSLEATCAAAATPVPEPHQTRTEQDQTRPGSSKELHPLISTITTWFILFPFPFPFFHPIHSRCVTHLPTGLSRFILLAVVLFVDAAILIFCLSFDTLLNRLFSFHHLLFHFFNDTKQLQRDQACSSPDTSHLLIAST